MFTCSSMRLLHFIPAVCALLFFSTHFASGLPLPEKKSSRLGILMQSISNDKTQNAKEKQQLIANHQSDEGIFEEQPSFRHIRDATPYYTPDTGFNRFQSEAGSRKNSDSPVFNQTLVSVISLRVSSSVAHATHPSINSNMNLYAPSLIAEATKKLELRTQEAEPTNCDYDALCQETRTSVSATKVLKDVPQDHLPYRPAQEKTHFEADSASSSSYQYLNTAPSSAPPHVSSTPRVPIVYAQPEENYEVDEQVSVETNGRAHGVQPTYRDGQHIDIYKAPTKADKDQKVGYVVEGRNYRKYRVEERTPDGFIVGEYGVMDHDDGSLRGVRYTADGTINPKLIHNALMKFLSL